VAEEWGVPGWTLVGNVLEEAFRGVEAVGENGGDLIAAVVDEAERTRHRIRHRRHRARHRSRRRYEDGEREPHPPSDDAEATAAAPIERQPHPDVIGWQPLIMNQAKACADCEEPIETGERGFAGVTGAGIGSVYLCRDCMDARH